MRQRARQVGGEHSLAPLSHLHLNLYIGRAVDMLANAGVRRAGVAAAPRKSTSRSAAVRASSRDSQRAQAAPGRAVLFTSDSLTGRQSLFRILRLPTLLLTALAFGVAFPEPGVQLAAAGGVAATTKLVFLLVGLGLRASDAKASTSHPFAALYAVVRATVESTSSA